MDLVLEIGAEEIPAFFIPQALASLKRLFEEKMQRARISHGPALTVGTPRRLALLADGVAQKQEDAYQDTLGPPKKLAFDSQGNPTTAALRFAKAQGLKVEDLNVIGTAKGEYLCARRKEAGRAAVDVLAQLLPDLIASIPFPKTMRWNQSSFRFARPIRWILAVASGEVIPFELAGVKSGNNSYGHRFMSPQTFSVTDIAVYMEGCRKNFVLVDPEERKEVIRKGLSDLALKLNGQVIEDPELLETVAFLAEHPVVLSGRFDPEFLKLPREALISVMRDAQFYFSFEAQDKPFAAQDKSLADERGELLPNFALAINSQVKDPAKVVVNNERVLKAKLTDAKFFFEEDSKIPLEKRVENLKGLVFQAKLGSAYDKSMRVMTLSDYLAQKVAPDLKEVVKRAAFLAKADLTTQMVIEFPKLQGVMGREYARLSGEKPEVAQAIHEHYLPLSYGREIPKSLPGAIVSIADKLDTIVGCFAVGLVPSGTADPYGLRRAALGIIQIIIEKGLSLSLKEILENTPWPALGRNKEKVLEEVAEFFRGRLFSLLNQDYPYELVDAALASHFDDIYLASLRLKALDNARKQQKLLPLAIAFKRINDIINAWLSKAEKQVARTIKRTKDPETRKRLEADRLFPIISGPASIDEEPQERLLSDPYECRLYQEHLTAKEKTRECLEKREFAIALDTLSGLKGPIDDFFDHVLVITGEESLRLNRLRLLNSIRQTFHKIADFSRIPV